MKVTIKMAGSGIGPHTPVRILRKCTIAVFCDVSFVAILGVYLGEVLAL